MRSLKSLIAFPIFIFSMSMLFIISLQAQQRIDKISCDDGTEFSLNPNHKLLKEIEVAKRDDFIVYGTDEDGRVYSFEYDEKTNKLNRTQIFRFPILGFLYQTFVDSSNSFQLLKDSDGQIMPWDVAHIRYENTRTIGLLVMTQKNPVRIQNMDPWLPPWQVYEHTGPFGVTGVNIAAGGQTIAIIGYNDKGDRVIAYRQMTFDLTGSNPMMTYQYPSGYIKRPSWILGKLGQVIGVPQEQTQLPTEDWQQINLDTNHQPYARILPGEKIAVAKAMGGASIYDTVDKKWVEDISIFRWPDNIEWPEYQKPLCVKPRTYRTMVDGIEGKITESSQEPERWKFQPDEGGGQSLYSYSSGFSDVLSNKKYLYTEQGKRVALSRLFAIE